MAKRRTVRPRRAASGGRKRRSAAQRAATARMLAANRSRRGARRSASAAPKRRRRRSAARRLSAVPRKQRGYARVTSRRRRRSGTRSGGSMRASVNGVLDMAMGAAVGGLGAVAVDIAMGQVAGMLPDGWSEKFDSDSGDLNLKYAAVKAALTAGIGFVGARFLPNTKIVAGMSLRDLTIRAAQGGLTVQTYELARSMVPADWVTLGSAQPRAGRSLRSLSGSNVAYLPGSAGLGETPRVMANTKQYNPAGSSR